MIGGCRESLAARSLLGLRLDSFTGGVSRSLLGVRGRDDKVLLTGSPTSSEPSFFSAASASFDSTWCCCSSSGAAVMLSDLVLEPCGATMFTSANPPAGPKPSSSPLSRRDINPPTAMSDIVSAIFSSMRLWTSLSNSEKRPCTKSFTPCSMVSATNSCMRSSICLQMAPSNLSISSAMYWENSSIFWFRSDTNAYSCAWSLLTCAVSSSPKLNSRGLCSSNFSDRLISVSSGKAFIPSSISCNSSSSFASSC
mmetsp:Transcript_94679/g.149780  ORF Transcript_94679/g.149780 Transcript_94679/m.149780 type:complete len:253 (+) Transcript_94679:1910-2668(+)